MRRPIIIALAFVLSAASLCAGGDAEWGRLDPSLRVLFTERSGPQPSDRSAELFANADRFQITLSLTGEPRLGVLVKTRESVRSTSYRGIPVSGRAGSILALSVTLAELATLAEDPDVVYVEPSWKTEPALDRSLVAVGADGVHDASPAVLGEGVVIGVVDTGIDYTHLDFRRDANADGSEESSRIYAIWDQTWGLFGAEYTRTEIEADLALGFGSNEGIVRASDTNGHGTHVAGIAAGDGSSSTGGFVGVAPGATLIAVKTSFFTADILSAVEYIFDKATVLGLPAVVNLSLGGQEGPHDGTSLFEEGIDQLAIGPGRIVVVSAGNEGDLPIHTSGMLNGNAKSFTVLPEEWELELELWYPGASQFTITVFPPNDAEIVVPTGAATGYVVTVDGTVYVDNASGGANPNNGDHEVFVRLANVEVGSRWRIKVADVAGGGRYDAWVTTRRGEIEGGDSTSTIDEPGNGHRVITVGSFNSKSTWPSIEGSQDYSAGYPVGAASSFSSLGPTRDGRTKPEISAPGAWICAAGSTDAPSLGYLSHPDGEHMMEIGTSMSAPHVAGAIALLLGLDSGMTAGEVRSVLTSTAATDAYTGGVPNTTWGWGKLDVEAAVAAVTASTPPEPPASRAAPEIGVEENPVTGIARFEISIPEAASTATLRVYTVAGVPIFEMQVPVDATSVEWDLRSDRGEGLAVGLYLYVLVTDRGNSEVGRLVIQR